jgi:hypothetical protein
MRFLLGLLVCAGLMCAQSELEQAKAKVEKLRALVAAGAVPRAQLAEAEASVADAEDSALLRRTVYGQDLTDEQSEAMIAAANRRLERRSQALERAKKLVDVGVTPRSSLDPLIEDADLARKEYDLAVSRAQVVHELTLMAEAEQSFEEAPATSSSHAISERHDGDGAFSMSRFGQVESAYERRFGKPLPVSAMGETEVHRALGFDHRGRVDVALNPDQPEGVWLRTYLDENRIPYFTFRRAVPGKATGAHIHLGPVSSPLAHADLGILRGRNF